MPLTTPNVVVFIADDQEVENVADPVLTAQQMPWLASRTDWVSLPNAWISTPLCGPARACFFTGRRGDQHAVSGNSDTADMDDTTTIAVALQAAGYRTGMIGKWLNHYTTGQLTVPPGWDRFFAINSGESTYFLDYTVTDDGVADTYGSTDADYSTDVFAAKAVDFVSVADPAPFLLVVPFTAPHYPSTPATRHAGAGLSLSDPPDWNTLPGGTGGPTWMTGKAAMTASEEADTRADREDAARTCLAMDEAIADIYDAVDAAGKLANTVFVFFTDNAHAKGRKRLGRQHSQHQKRSPYRYASTALMRVRYPGVAGRVERRLVSTMDIPASIVEWAAATHQFAYPGRDLGPLLEQTTPTWRDAVEGYYSGTAEGGMDIPQWWSLRTERWRYAEYAGGDRDLYDWNADPHEQTNLAGNPAYADVQAELAGILDELIADPHARDDVPVGGATVRNGGAWVAPVADFVRQGGAWVPA